MEEKEKRKKIRLTKEMTMLTGFLSTIFLGAVLLMMPISSVKGRDTTFLEALFTSVTSVCVTGITVVDTSTHWSFFGQLVIMGMVQVGGLGIIFVVALLALVARREFSLSDKFWMKDSLALDDTNDIARFFVKILFGTLVVEGVGALLYMLTFVPRYGFLKGVWYSCFTSVSAFCNAGLSVINPNSMGPFSSDPFVLIVTMLLIVIGGIGFLVWKDVQDLVIRCRSKRNSMRYCLRLVSEHTKMVMILTGVLIFGGAALILVLEGTNPGTLGGMSAGDKIMNSLFQSVTLRTAGFTTIPQEELTESSVLAGVLIMFIGGSPVGTAGGVKTVTMFIILLNVYAFIRNRNDVVFLRRRIDEGIVRKATAIITVQFALIFVLSLLLMKFSGIDLTAALYEIVSAVSTVGLSRDVTVYLNESGKVIDMLAMFLGRIGPIAMLLFFRPRTVGRDGIVHADGKYVVG